MGRTDNLLNEKLQSEFNGVFTPRTACTQQRKRRQKSVHLSAKFFSELKQKREQLRMDDVKSYQSQMRNEPQNSFRVLSSKVLSPVNIDLEFKRLS